MVNAISTANPNLAGFGAIFAGVGAVTILRSSNAEAVVGEVLRPNA
jgi:hypothetical protein